MKKRFLLVGFWTDYGRLDKASLSVKYNVCHISISPLYISFLLRLKEFFPKCYTLIIKKIISSYLSKGCYDYIICDDNILAISLFHEVLNNNVEAKKILMYRNIIKDDSQFISFKDKGVSIYTFDKEDANHYDLMWYPQYCSGFFELEKTVDKKSKEIDCYFLGRDKGRMKLVNELESLLMGFNNKIIVIPSRRESVFSFKKKKYISYIQHLLNVRASKVIIDLVQEGQNGLTMRTLEGILCGCKIITNNPCVTKIYKNYEKHVFLLPSSESMNIDHDALRAFIDSHDPSDINICANDIYSFPKIVDDFFLVDDDK